MIFSLYYEIFHRDDEICEFYLIFVNVTVITGTSIVFLCKMNKFILRKRIQMERKIRSDLCQTDHCHHRRYPVRPVPLEGFCRFVVTLSGFFSTFLKFVIPLMILAYVTMGIADLSQGAESFHPDHGGSGLWLPL